VGDYPQLDPKLTEKQEEKKSFIRKVPGFRSGKWYKSVLAVCMYCILLLAFIVAISPSPSTDTANNGEQDVVSTDTNTSSTGVDNKPGTQDINLDTKESPELKEPTPEPESNNSSVSQSQSAETDYSFEETAYVRAITEQSRQWGNTLTKLGEYLQAPQYADQNWVINVATQLATMRTLAEEARNLDPPPKFKEVHSQYLLACESYEKCSHLLANGIDNFDVDKINQAAEQMFKGNEHIQNATRLMQTINSY